MHKACQSEKLQQAEGKQEAHRQLLKDTSRGHMQKASTDVVGSRTGEYR